MTRVGTNLAPREISNAIKIMLTFKESELERNTGHVNTDLKPAQ